MDALKVQEMKDKRFLAYSASAGSGKTYALALRYIALLFLGQNPSEILAATFTKKAANEMEQRVLKVLQNLKDDEVFLNSLISEYGFNREEILAKQEQVLGLFLKSKNYIMTLDSLFNSILRSAALNIGLEPDFTIKSLNSQKLEEHFIKHLEFSGQMGNFVNLALNLQKRKSEDFIKLFEDIYAIDALLPKGDYGVKNLQVIVDTIFKLQDEAIKELESLKAPKRTIGQFSKRDIKAIIAQNLYGYESIEEHSWFTKYTSPRLEEIFAEIKVQIANYLSALENTILYYLFNLYEHYKSARLQRARGEGELDFVDILYLTQKLLENELIRDFLYFKLDTKFKHILLDEFQDTSAVQYLILKPLIDEIFAGQGQSEFRTFFYVGDVKQSLYRFRGGVEELFDYVAKRYSINIATLDTNYRSAKNIVNSVNEIFASKMAGFVPQKANSNKEGYVEVSQAQELLEEASKRIEFLKEHQIALEDIAILTFTNKDGIALQEHLTKNGIDSVLKSASSLKFNKKIAALVGVLEYIVSGEEIYIEPFKQKLGIQSVDISICKENTLPYLCLLKIIEHYAYYQNDPNILRLLEFAKDFSTIEEFLEEFKESDIDLAPHTQKGVAIMTIHGSKGLEFKYVIVLDRLGKKPNRGGMLLFKNASPIKIEQIFYNQKGKENFVPSFAKAKEEELTMQAKDSMNLLYVALTRAELGMFIVQKEKGSEFAPLELAPFKIGTIEPPEPKQEIILEALPQSVGVYGKQEVEQLEQEEQSLKDIKAMLFGEALHFALEMLDFSNSQTLNIAIEALTNHYGSRLEQEQIESIKRRIVKVFESSEFLELINGCKLFKEQPIVYKEHFYQIDLLAKSEHKNIIFDYKSSKNFAPKHIKQVANYIEALKAIESKECEGYILYMLESGVEVVRV